MIIAVVNLKGGTNKTTTSAYLLHALYEADQRVIGLDADGENESLRKWSELGGWPFSVSGVAVADLHKQIPPLTVGQYDSVVIDTPPMRERRKIVASAVRAATHVVVPMAPTTIEAERITAVQDLVDEVSDLRDGGRPPTLAVMLNGTVPHAASTATVRGFLEDAGVHVLKAEVARRERFAQAYPDPITNAANTAFGDAVSELLDLEDTT